MKTCILTLTLFLTALFATTNSNAALITFDVNIVDDTVQVGDTIDWEIFVTVSNSDANNFGIATVSANLTDTIGDMLNAGTISAPFTDNGFTSGGTVSGNQLVELTSVSFIQSNFTTDGIEGANLGPHLFAFGSYVPTTIGTHTLEVSAGSANLQYTAANQFNGAGTVDFDTVFNSAMFNVSESTAVPEPSSCAVLALASMCGIFRRRRA